MLIIIVRFELQPGQNQLNLKLQKKKGNVLFVKRFNCWTRWSPEIPSNPNSSVILCDSVIKTNDRTVHSHVEQMQQLCMIVSCHELGGTDAVHQNMCVKWSFTLCTPKLAMDDSQCSEHVKGDTERRCYHSLQCCTAWQAGLQKGHLFQSYCCSWSLKAFTPSSPQWHMSVLADDVEPKDLPMSEGTERGF